MIAPLGFTMLAYALLWRNEQARRQPDAEPLGATATTPERATTPGAARPAVIAGGQADSAGLMA